MKIASKMFVSNIKLEGGSTHAFIQDALDGFDVTGKDILEVGPKHGMHTMLFDALEPASLTLIELPEKKANQQLWMNSLKTQCEVNYCDFLRWNTSRTYDVLLFCGVIYHNTEQLRMLKKLHTLANESAVMIFESSTTRDRSLIDKNVIEVHWPNPYRNTKTVIFHPSKRACASLLNIAGWSVEVTSDDFLAHSNTERWACICKKDRVLTTYDDIDHTLVE